MPAQFRAPFNKADIRNWCGETSYKRGQHYFEEGRVLNVEYDPDFNSFEASVRGSGRSVYHVSVRAADDWVEAECDCPAYDAYLGYDNYCKHIAATMIAIVKGQVHFEVPTAGAYPGLSFASMRSPQESTSASATQPPAPAPKPKVSKRDQQITRHFLNVVQAITRPTDPAGQAATLASNALAAPADPGHAYPAHATQPPRETLSVAFVCNVMDFYSQDPYITLGMRVGVKRLYKVHRIREFLEKVQARQPHKFTKNFTYLPDVHEFSETDAEIVRKLLDLYELERLFNRHSNPYSFTSTPNANRPDMFIPPSVFHALLPSLKHANVEVHVGGAEYPKLVVVRDRLPVHFQVTKDDSGAYVLDLYDLRGLTVLKDYGYAVYEGQFHPLPAEQLELLEEAVNIVKHEPEQRLLLEDAELPTLMERVIPQLQEVAQVAIAEDALAEITYLPLEAKLYLDADGPAITIDLVFTYGDTEFRPLAVGGGGTGTGAAVPNGPLVDADGRTIVRDRGLEEHILSLFSGLPLQPLGSAGPLPSRQAADRRLALVDDDAIYHFLYEVLPVLNNLVDVYATNAVDPITDTARTRPRTSVDVRGNQLLDVQFDIDGIDPAEVHAVLQSLSEKKRYHRLKNGTFVRLEAEEYAELGHLMDDLGVRPAAVKGGKVAIPLMQGFHALPVYDQSSRVKLARRVRGLVDDILHPDRLEFPIPPNLHATLRDYQQTGFQWMKTLAHYGFGGILADDMGLGKTIQSIAFILSELDNIRAAGTPVLIVAPSSLIYNWRNEIEKFAPDVNAVVIAGNATDRDAALGALQADDNVAGAAGPDPALTRLGAALAHVGAAASPAAVNASAADISAAADGADAGPALADVYITSYPLLRIDAEKYVGRVFHTVILDEAQAIKNHLTQIAQTVRTLQANHRFALTGTPIENSLDELWSIFHFAFPAMFPNHKAFSQMQPEDIARRVRPFILRRLKKDVLKELPDKIETLYTSELTPDQKKLYLAYLERIQQDSAAEIAAQGFQKSRMKILAGLTRLRQICCHPSLFAENYRGSSGKLEELLKLLERCRAAGKRVLIFSQFTLMLGLIRDTLNKQGIDAFYLDGATPAKERTVLCDRFNAGERDVFLISLKAGGTGLNLTGADTVILYDLWWNPAVEDQAADRTHRIGQKNVVQVIRMVARGTIEERIYELQQKKRNLIDQVVDQGDAGLSALTEEEIRELLSL